MTDNIIKILDDGFVRLVDKMGNDAAIVQAARVSYGEGTKAVSDDKSLIMYLLRHRHTTPFEMVEFKFHVRVPMDCWRQWIRHRSASVNEYSTRYSLAIDSKAKTPQDKWRKQSNDNKQGSNGYIDQLGEIENIFNITYDSPGEYFTKEEEQLHKVSDTVYKNRLASGIAREQARKDLPLSNYTEAYWKIDLHNLLHFLKLRLDKHAQEEIRLYAEAIASLIKPVVPIAWEAFEIYTLNHIELTMYDVMIIKTINSNPTGSKEIVFEQALLSSGVPQSWMKPKCRERLECEEKLKKLGFL